MTASRFDWPDAAHEVNSYHSTQFSFDDSQIVPNLMSSPSLSNHLSIRSVSPSVGDRDVVEALTLMADDCPVIVYRFPMDDIDEKTASEPMVIEWGTVTLKNQQKVININASKPLSLSLSDIQNVDKLHEATASRLRNEMNIPGVHPVGLQSLTLRLTTRSDGDYFLIFENSRDAFIWKKGLCTLLRIMDRGEAVTTTIAFCCSSLDRINDEEQHQKMNLNLIHQWIQRIQSTLPSARKQIDRCHRFAEKSCILDSSEHLSLLLQCDALRALCMDATRLSSLSVYQLSRDEKYALREVWLSLLADLSVAMLKERQLRSDMTASTQIPTALLTSTSKKNL